MLHFLQLLHPPNMRKEDDSKVEKGDENITFELADKYEVKNIIKQCLRETNNLEPDNTMCLLVHVMRHDLPVEKVSNVIARHISTDTLANFAPEIDNESDYSKTVLETKCRVYENGIERASTLILCIINKHVTTVMDRPIEDTHGMTNLSRVFDTSTSLPEILKRQGNVKVV